jgi:hypothetical protein
MAFQVLNGPSSPKETGWWAGDVVDGTVAITDRHELEAAVTDAHPDDSILHDMDHAAFTVV